jgi:hypothetical protein
MRSFTPFLRQLQAIFSRREPRQVQHRRARCRPLVEQLELRTVPAFVINPTFALNIQQDSNAATIEATINRTITAYESLIADNDVVNITFQEGGGLGGSSGGLIYNENYQSYYNALVSHQTSANDATAIASLPNQATDPVNGQTTIGLRAALARALGFNAPTPQGDGTITLNTGICNLDRTSPQDPTKYDLQAVTAHEIDEICGFGSTLDSSNNESPAPTGQINADDLFRYGPTGFGRSYTTNPTVPAYFSIDGGTTDLARFNQTHTQTIPNSSGDFGDWYSYFGGQTPQVQDAFNTRGANANLGVELTRLDVLGYTLTPVTSPLNVSVSPNTTVAEGALKGYDLGSFTDGNGAGPWGVTVSWGDGSPNTTYFLNSAGSLGTQFHYYAEEGVPNVSVTVADFTGQTATANFNVTVSDPAVIPVGAAITAVEGQSFTQAVATFTDPGGPEPNVDYGATINWGDGSTPTAGVISYAGIGVFNVTGTHTYAEESAAYAITVTISHDVAPDAVANSTAAVFDPAVSPVSAAITAVEGQLFTQAIATFTDPGGAEALGDYGATISWGDGSTPTAGLLSFSGGVFTVTGTHTYAEESAADPIAVTISHDSAPDAIANSTAMVADPAVLPSGGFSFTAVEGAASALVTVATFTDPGGAEAPGDYSADINWGDSTGTQVGAGVITLASGVYTVQGTHAYADATSENGNVPYTITVTIHHDSAPTASATSTATVSDPNPVLGMLTFAPHQLDAIDGRAVRGQPVTFTTPYTDVPSDGPHTAIISWGDLTPNSTVTTTELTATTGSATLNHVYSADGTYTVTETVMDDGSGVSTQTFTVNIVPVDVQPCSPPNGMLQLVVGGTPFDDNIQVSVQSNNGQVTYNVQIHSKNGNVDLGTFQTGNVAVPSGLCQVLIYDLNGNDNIQANNTSLPVGVFGGDGNDQVHLGDGNNSVVLGNGNDQVHLGNGNNSIALGTGSDSVHAGDGTNRVTAGALGTAASDQVQLGRGANDFVMLLGDGSDNVHVGDGNGDAMVIIGNGNDQVQAGNGNGDTATIIGAGDDQIHLGDGNGDFVSVTGNGNDQVQIGNGTADSVSIVGNGNEDVRTGNGSGNLSLVGAGQRTVHLGKGWTQM